AVVVAPVGDVPARRHVVDRVERPAGGPFEDGQVFGAVEDGAGVVADVGVGVADHGALAVGGAVGRLDDDLGRAVGVVVVHLGLAVVGAGADVHAQVDPPQLGAVELVRVQEHVAGVAGLGVVLGVGGVPFEDQLELAVP